MLRIEPHIKLQTIKIWAPKYSTNEVLVGKHHIKEFNRIIFTKAKHLAGKEFFISSKKIRGYPTQSNNGKPMYVVPFDDLQEMERIKVW